MSEHVHECEQWKRTETCEAPCVCACGAVWVKGPTYKQDGRWVWELPEVTEPRRTTTGTPT